MPLNFEFFISRHIIKTGKGSLSRPPVRIAVISVSLGTAVMIVSLAVLMGFQEEIREKVSAFASHIQITSYDLNQSYETRPIAYNHEFVKNIQSNPYVKHIQPFATKAGIIRTKQDIQGVVFKGVDSTFDWSFFGKRLDSGNLPMFDDTAASKSILISRKLANMLNIKTGDDVRMYFVIEGEAQPRGRKFEVSAIYNTGLEEFDKITVFGDIRQIRKLNGWGSGETGGYELYIRDFEKIDEAGKSIYQTIPYDMNARTVKELFPQIFDWLELQDVNVLIILILMILVSIMAVTSSLLILILERTSFIGIMKAMGTRDWAIRKIFLNVSAYIILQGMFWGNLAGLGICYLQSTYKIMKLPQESYYMQYVPVSLHLSQIIILNIATFIICTLVLIIPTVVISKITPVKAIKYD
jgi:lipoprotein-releasing system permease protein